MVQKVRDFLGAKALKDKRREFDRGDREVQQNAPEDLEQERVVVPHDNRVPESKRQADVQQQCRAGTSVAQKGDQDRRLHEWPKLLEPQDIDQEANRKAAGGEG